jgi:hypothetical protein
LSSVTFIEIKFRTGIPQKQLYARVNTWLRFNDCVIVSEKEPTHIEAIYRGNVLGVDGEPAFGSMNQSEITALPQTIQTLNDPYSKEIHVKIHELDGEACYR